MLKYNSERNEVFYGEYNNSGYFRSNWWNTFMWGSFYED